MALRLAFFGTPDYAIPTLRAIAALDPSFASIVQVVTQPDKPRGAGLRVSPTPVRAEAERLHVPVTAPAKVRTGEFRESIRALDLDLAIVIAYGRIVPAPVLAIPRLGFVNLHGSLLPRLRGAAPIQWAIARGETVTGVTLMRMDAGLDTGPILATAETPIAPSDDAESLTSRLATLSADLAARSIEPLARGALTARPQDEADATYAPVLKKEDGIIEWDAPPREIVDRVRAFCSWPGAQTWIDGESVRILRADVAMLASSDSGATSPPPGTVIRASARGAGELVVAARGGAVSILGLQAAGKRPLSAQAFLVGHRVSPGARLGR